MKRIYIFSAVAVAFAVVLFLCPQFINAQQTAPSIQWEKALGGSDYDVAYDIQQTSDGGFIIAGTSNSNNGDVTGNHDSSDYWIVRLDASGIIQWEKSYGGSGDEIAQSIIQTNDGGYIVAGWSDSKDGDVHGNHGGYDYWVVKLDNSGGIQWDSSYGGSGFDFAYSIVETNDGGYVIGGISNSQNGEVTGNHGGYDYWIVKIDSNGAMKWEKSYGGSGDDGYISDEIIGNNLQKTNDGGFVLAGSSNSNDGDVTGHHGNVTYPDYWIVKIDGTGTMQWERSLGGSNVDAAKSITQTSDGGYIIAGISISNDGDVTGNHGSGDYWIVKLDSLGKILWQKSLGGSGTEIAYNIQKTTDGGYIVAGSSWSNDGDVTGNHGTDDYWIVKLNGNGKLLWEKSLGGRSLDDAYKILQTNDGGYIVAGTSISNDGDVTGNHGGDDYWVVRLTPPPVISSSQKQTLFPLMCGAQEPDTLYIHNIGKGPLTIDSANFGGNANYSLVSPSSFPVNIAPGDSLRSIILFTSSAVGTYPGTLSIVNNDQIAGHSPWLVNFTGMKDSIGVRVNRVKNDTLDFGAVVTSTSKDSTFVIINTSTTGTTFSVRTHDVVFHVDSSLFLSFNTGGTVKVHFAGENAPGRYVDSLIITDTCGRTQTVYLAATVKSGIPAGIQITDPIDAGYVHINTQKTVPFTIKNTSAASITIDSMTLTGTNAQYYQLKNVPQLPFTIAAGNTQTMDVTFSPINAGTQDATLEITASISSTAIDIAVEGIGTRSVLEANALNFDTVGVSTCKTDTMKVTNAGNYPLLISQIAILGVYAGEYTILTTVSDTLHPGESADIAIKYCPTVSGEEDVIAELITSDGDTLFVNIYGAGSGTNAVCEILPSGTSLSQNYPNPFTNMTVIHVTLSPQDGQSARLKVYNVLGEEVADLSQELRQSNDVTFTANNLQAGVYFYTLETATRQLTRQMFVVK